MRIASVWRQPALYRRSLRTWRNLSRRSPHEAEREIKTMTFYEVWIRGQKVKEYPHLLQAQTYLILKGFIYTGDGYYFTDPDAEIRKVTK